MSICGMGLCTVGCGATIRWKGKQMIVGDGYSLIYDKYKNRIVILLPQTMETLTNTKDSVTDRKIDITADEQSLILNVVKAVFERRSK